jgi:hypothetical protein
MFELPYPLATILVAAVTLEALEDFFDRAHNHTRIQ